MENMEIGRKVRFDGPAEMMPKPGVLKQLAQDLKANMGEWGLLGRCNSSGTAGQRAYVIRQGEQAGFEPAGSFEAEARSLLGEHRVYARYVGPDA